MDIQQLRYVVRSARYGSFSEAAQSLFVTRAALGKSVAQLESELGYPLFVRTSGGVSLTEAGQRFLPRAQEVLSSFEQLEEDMKHDAEALNLTVFLPNSWYDHFAARLNAHAASHANSVPVCAADLVHEHVFYYACGYEKVFWVPLYHAREESFSNDLMHIYSCIHRNEGVLPTPLFTAPGFSSDVVYRRVEEPGSDITLYGYVSPHLAEKPRLRDASLAVRRALICC